MRHYHSPDDFSWDEWRLSDSEVERIYLENAASPEGADELEEMTADEMAVDGYYVVAGIARHEYKQGWKLVTLWDGYALSEATWEPMSAFIQPDGSIDPIFGSYLVEKARSVFPPWRQVNPQLGPLTGPDPWGSTLPYRVYHTPKCATYVCVSHFSPRRGSWRPGLADVGPKVLVSYYYHSYGAQFLCWRLSLGEDGKSPTY